MHWLTALTHRNGQTMSPFEKFLDQMTAAARLTQDNDPRAATHVIQQALKAAGLLPTHDAPRGEMSVPEPIDLNPLPEWLQKAHCAKDVVRDAPQRSRRSLPAIGRARMPAYDPRAPGEFLQGSFNSATDRLDYKLYVPSRPATTPRPLIVMLHGCTQNADDFAAGTAMKVLAEAHDCLVLYPEQSHRANPTLCWNWFEAEQQGREGREPSLIAGMTREVTARWQGDQHRVYVAGLSAGGAMAAVMGATYPDVYAAIGVHSGLPVGTARDLVSGMAAMKKARSGRGRVAGKVTKPVPIIVFHGDMDDKVHPYNGEAVLEQFLHPVQGSCNAAHRQIQHGGEELGFTRTEILDSVGRAVAEYWQLHRAGHAWSGGSAAGSYTNPAGPDASAEMLRFFLSQAN